jgi:hypothetical protein
MPYTLAFHRPRFSPKATMNDKFKELVPIFALIGSIVSGFFWFLYGAGIPGEIAARYGDPIKDLFLVVCLVLLIIASVCLLINYDIASAGANPIGTGPREKYDALRLSLAAHEDALTHAD